MALLHRDRTDGTTTTAAGDTVAAPGYSSDAGPAVVRKNSVGQTTRTVVATVILAAVVLVAAVNTDRVDVDLVFEQYEAPLAALVGGAAVAGFLIGLLLGIRRHPRH